MNELELMQVGVRFTVGSAPALTSTGHTYQAPVLRVSGPPDRPDILQAIREAVEARMGLVDGGHSGIGVCARCGSPLPTIIHHADGTQSIRTDVAMGACSLCRLARSRSQQ